MSSTFGKWLDSAPPLAETGLAAITNAKIAIGMSEMKAAFFQFFDDILCSLGPLFRFEVLVAARATSGARRELGHAWGRISSGVSKVTPVGFEMGVGSGLRNGVPLSRSHRNSIALSSCMVLWQCSMNMPPQSRNCILRVTEPLSRRR